jgi:acyl transferase domain-containing protein/phosphopantetheinyl transferase
MAADRSDIAVIGISARFAGAPDVETYWENILAGVEALSEASDRWALPYFDPNSTANNRIYTRRGGFLDEKIGFNPAEFGIMPNTVGSADVDQFLGLLHSRDALANAGYVEREFDRRKTGIILGRGTYVNRGYNTLLQHGQAVDQIADVVRALLPEASDATLERLKTTLQETLPNFSGEIIPSLVPNVITGRIASRLDLMGPNYIIDAACASSLIAIGLAVDELRSGRCDMMLSGAIHATTPPQVYMMFCQLNGLSHGSLRPFDRAADGTLLGEGVGILVLKRLADAEAAGDRIYGVIKGVGRSSDGRALGLLAPRGEGQVVALERAYEDCGIDPATIGLIEAHGTGMPLGDKTEIETLRAVFGDREGYYPALAVGSVKSMIGHCIPAAGAAGTIKALLALKDKVLPPTLCDEVNPELDIESANFYINNRTRPWIRAPKLGPRRAAINAFGFGGVNAHLVLEEYDDGLPEQSAHAHWPHELLLVSADDRPALIAELGRLRARVQEDPELRLGDLARTLSRREAKPQRVALVCGGNDDAVAKLERAEQALIASDQPRGLASAGIVYGTARSREERGGIAFLFPGEGGQHEDMLLDLCLHVPSVRAWFDLLDEALIDAPVAPSRVFFPAPTGLTETSRRNAEELRNSLEYGSAGTFIAGLALHDLLTRCGIGCDVMVGHSSGDGTALVASGMVRLTGRDELVAGLARFNRACQELTSGGHIERGMLLTVGGIDPARVEAVVENAGGRLHIALDNCPNQIVIFGTREDIEAASATLIEAGAVCVSLPFDRAYHTPLLGELEPRLRPLYDELDFGSGVVPVVSCASMDNYPVEPEAARELATQQWFSRVRFRETMQKLHDDGIRTFVEVGPGATLSGFVRDSLKGRSHATIASNVRGKSALLQFELLLGSLFVAGSDVDLAPLFDHRPVRHLDLDAPVRKDATIPAMTLDQIMPVLRLDAAVAREISDEIRANLPQAAEMRSPPEPVREIEPASQPAPQIATPVAIDPRLGIVQAHFSLMNEFLASQERMLGQLSRVAPATPALAQSAPAQLPANWPLLGRVVEQNATRLVTELELSVERFPFLVDHAFGVCESVQDPGLRALSVVPFTVSMEMVAEAAHRLTGGRKRVVGLHTLRGQRWMALDAAAMTITIEADMLASDEVKVVVYAEPAAGRQPSNTAFEGIARLADAFPAAPNLPAFDIGREEPVHYTPTALYGKTRDENIHRGTMFHGPAFQAVTGIRRVGTAGIEADMRILPTTPFAATGDSPRLAVDPVVLDAAGQLVGYWVGERFGVDLSFFPFAAREYRQHAEWPEAGARIVCQASIRLATPDARAAAFEFVDKTGSAMLRLETDSVSTDVIPAFETCRLDPASAWIEANFRFITTEGRLLAELDGWCDRYFGISHRFYRFRLWPGREYLSEPYLQQTTGLFTRRIDRQREAFLDQSWGIWKRVLAHLTLSRRERAQWHALPGQGSRQTEWLLGRVAAKDAVRQWARARYGIEISPPDVEILPDRLGRPEVVCGLLRERQLPHVSISHNKSAVFGVAVDPEEGVGIDHAEPSEVRADDVLAAAFSASELALIPAGTAAERAMQVLRFWCAKEAAAKACGRGLEGDPRSWLIGDYDAASGAVTVVKDRAFSVRTWIVEGEVIAVCRDTAAVTAIENAA